MHSQIWNFRLLFCMLPFILEHSYGNPSEREKKLQWPSYYDFDYASSEDSDEKGHPVFGHGRLGSQPITQLGPPTLHLNKEHIAARFNYFKPYIPWAGPQFIPLTIRPPHYQDIIDLWTNNLKKNMDLRDRPGSEPPPLYEENTAAWANDLKLNKDKQYRPGSQPIPPSGLPVRPILHLNKEHIAAWAKDLKHNIHKPDRLATHPISPPALPVLPKLHFNKNDIASLANNLKQDMDKQISGLSFKQRNITSAHGRSLVKYITEFIKNAYKYMVHLIKNIEYNLNTLNVDKLMNMYDQEKKTYTSLQQIISLFYRILSTADPATPEQNDVKKRDANAYQPHDIAWSYYDDF